MGSFLWKEYLNVYFLFLELGSQMEIRKQGQRAPKLAEHPAARTLAQGSEVIMLAYFLPAPHPQRRQL